LANWILLPQSQLQQLWRTAKAQQASPTNSVSWQISCRQQHQALHCPVPITRKQCKASWTATYLNWLRQTWTLEIGSNSGCSGWLRTNSLDHSLLIFCQRQHRRHLWREFSLSAVPWQQDAEIEWRNLLRCEHF